MFQKNVLKNIGTVFLVSQERITGFLEECGFSDIYLREDETGNHLFFDASEKRVQQIQFMLEEEFSGFFHRKGLSPQEQLVGQLKSGKMMLGVAESCTGGMLGSLITSVSGASSVFWGGFLVYHNSAKMELAGVSPETLEQYGAVSRQVVMEMVTGILQKSVVDLGIAVSGIAGPGGGSSEKPVGTVWIGVGKKNEPGKAFGMFFSGVRSEIRKKAATASLLLTLAYLENLNLDTNRNWQYT